MRSEPGAATIPEAGAGRRRRCLLWSVGLLAAHGPAAAQTVADEMTVLGTRLPAPAVLPAEEIGSEALHDGAIGSVVDAMRTLPGVTVIEPGGPGGLPELYLRGADSNFTVVFVDGVRMNDPTDARGGAVDLSAIAVGEVERIELVRGPFSALYGSGALAGAIDVRTRGAAGAPGGDARIAVGSDGYREAGGYARGPFGRGNGSISVNHLDAGMPVPGSTREVSSAGAGYALELARGAAASFALRASEQQRTSYPVAGGGPRLAAGPGLESADADTVSMNASLAMGGEARSLRAELTLLRRRELTLSPPIPEGFFSGVPGGVSDSRFDRYGLLLQSRFDLPAVELGAGFEYQRERGDVTGELDLGVPVATGFVGERTIVAPFVEGRASLGPAVTVFAGLRYDDASDADAALSPRIGIAWEPAARGLAVTATWGKATKTPSFYALGDPLVGNPALVAEQSEGLAAAVKLPLQSDGPALTLSVYRDRYSDLIDFDFASFRLVNRSRVDTRGVELALDGDVGERLQWNVFVAAHENEVDGAPDALLHRPERSAGARVTWRLSEAWSLSALLHHEGERPSSSIPGGPEALDPYTVVHAALVGRIAPSLDVRIAVHNVFDAEHEAVAGFPAPGRQASVELRRRFGERDRGSRAGPPDGGSTPAPGRRPTAP